MATRRARLAALLAAAALAAGCTHGDASPSPGPTQAVDPVEVYRAIAADVVAIRGLDAPDRIDPKVIDADQLRANLEAEFATSNPDAQISLTERVYKALGLLPGDASLKDLVLDLQGSQVIGYYDPSVDELFIISRSGGLGPLERVTYAHEFTHELQDRHFDLESLGLDEAVDEGDRALAALSLVEGDAVSAQTTWMTSHLTAVELGQIAAAAADPEMLAVLGRTPAILLETSLFPYQAGVAFVSGLIAQGGYDAVNAAFDRLPESTEQILHPEKYTAREAPDDVTLPANLAGRLGSGWTLDAQDTLGELQLRVWLREAGVKGDVARVATEGWGGDRLGLLGGPGGDAVVLVTTWDTTADAAEFAEAVDEVLTHLTGASVRLGKGVATVVGTAEIGEDELLALLNPFVGG